MHGTITSSAYLWNKRNWLALLLDLIGKQLSQQYP